MLVINHRLSIPLQEFDFSFARSGGPGGQNVNKVNSKVTLRWNVDRTKALPPDVLERFRDRFRRRITNEGDLLLTSQRFRDQGRNVADCLDKLRAMILEVATAPQRRIATRPTHGSQRRRLADKKRQSERKASRKRPRLED